MAGSVNKVILVGNLGADPEVRHTQDGTTIVNLRVATSEQWRDRASGERRERTEWHRVVVWSKQAENCAKYLAKGRSVLGEGRLQTRSWDDKNSGEKKYMTEIVANSVQFLGGGERGGGGAPGGGGGGGYGPPRGRGGEGGGGESGGGAPSGGGGDFGGPPSDDDIPF